MRIATILVLLAASLAPLSASAQPALNPNPLIWHGVQLGGEEVYEGEFTVDYATSTFLADGASAQDAVWLSGWEDRPGDGGGITRRYHIRLIGRKSVEPGKFGSLGAYANTILLIKLLSARLLSQR